MTAGSIISFSSISLTLGPTTSSANLLTALPEQHQSVSHESMHEGRTGLAKHLLLFRERIERCRFRLGRDNERARELPTTAIRSALVQQASWSERRTV